MRALAVKPAVAMLALLALACQKPDVGSVCTLQWGTDPSNPPPAPSSAKADSFQTGNLACDDLVCIVSPAPADSKYSTRCADPATGVNCGYCSKPCVSNQDCYTSETGLVCDIILPDPAFVASLDPDVRQRYLADIAFSSYCVVPRQ
jgi:hypothetical protein